jgi:hypothetical protein
MNLSYRLKATALGAVMAATAGCTTSYVGKKMEASGQLADPPGGVPFVMTRPEYTLSIAADAADPTKAVYTLAAAYVPDAAQRFTIALDPGPFVSGKFDLDFGDNGNLTSAVATTNTRVVDTFSAFVGLALKVAALLDAGNTLDGYKMALLANHEDRCTRLAAGGKATVQGELTKLIEELQSEAAREVGDKTNARRLVAELVGERLHYQSHAQRDCMVAVVEAVKTEQEVPFQKSYAAALTPLAAAAKDNAELSLLQSQIKAEVAALNDDALQKTADGLAGRPAPFDVALTAAQAGKQLVQVQLAGRFGRFLAGMPPEVWRARHLGFLDRQLARCQVESILVRPGSFPCSPSDIAALRIEWGATLGESAIVARLAKVDRQLADVPAPAATARDKDSAVESYIKLREERDKLQARIDQVRTDLLGKNKTVAMGAEAAKAAKVEARSNVVVSLVKKSYVDKVNASPSSFSSLPEFVLVLEPDDKGGGILAAPEGAKK